MNTKDATPFPEQGDYLWDGSGPPDPEIQQLEGLLAQYGHDGRPLTVPEELPLAKRRRQQLAIRFAAAAVILVAVGSLAYLTYKSSRVSEAQVVWECVAVSGNPQIGSRTIVKESTGAKFRVGQTLVTDAGSRASIWQEDLGEIQVEPNSRVRLVQSGVDRKRIQLERGTIHAAIWAPPTEFVVDTPSATAVDLGCAYTLQVNADGSGTLRTTLGWVGFHLNGRDSFIPAGAMCLTRLGVGPDTPYFEDASAQFREALQAFDASEPGSDKREEQLTIVLGQARAKDALTLWHLLSRTSGAEREHVYDRLAVLVPPPHGVTRDGVLSLNRQMLDGYWDELGLGRISVWRMWEQSATPAS